MLKNWIMMKTRQVISSDVVKALKRIWKSRTMRWGLLLVIFGVIEANMGFVQTYLAPWLYGLIISIIGIITGFFRIITTTPLFEKEDKNNVQDS